MIVCVCKNINSKQILDSVIGGASSVEQVRAETGASSCCGKCQFRVNSLVQDQLSKMDIPEFYNAAVSA